MPADRLFLDTNVLLTATVPARPGHERATQLLVNGLASGTVLVASGQVLREYLAVATRPTSANGLGLDAGEATHNAAQFASRVEVLAEDREVASKLRDLVRERQVRGRQVHDASIVATMLVHGIHRLLTADGGDFARYADDITVLALLGEL